MAGELQIKDWTLLNIGNANFLPGQCVDIDAANSDVNKTAALLATNATEVIGVCYDQSKLNPDGTVVKGTGIAVRSIGIAKCVAAGAIAPGAYVSVAATLGNVQAQAQAGAGVQPKAIVGRALTQAQALNDTILVWLMIGARY